VGVSVAFAKNELVTYEVCKDDCEYTDINDVIEDVNYLYSDEVAYDVIINIKDSETYNVENFDYTGEGYTQIYNIFVNSITIQGVGSKNPKLVGEALDIISGPSFDGQPETIKIKNVDFEINGNWGTSFNGVDVIIEGSNFDLTSTNGLFIGGSDSIQISDSTFDVKNAGHRKVRLQGPVTIDNVKFNSNTYGIELSGNYSNELNGLTVSTKEEYGVLINTFNVTDNFVTTITNSDLSNNDISLVATNTYLTGDKKLKTKNEYDVVIKDTKLNRVGSYKFDNNYEVAIDQPAIFVNKGCEWNAPIKSLNLNDEYTEDEYKKANKIESDNGKVVVEMFNKISLNVGDTKGVSIKDLFKSLDIEEISDSSWISVNNDFYTVKDGFILPLKEGNNTISYTYKNVNYELEISVLGAEKNPNTTTGLIIWLIMVSLVSMFILIKSSKRLN